MVLQRGREIPVWGWAEPGEAITVSMGGNTRQTVAGAGKQWTVRLPAMTAGGPFLLTIRGNKTVAFKDVMAGEVWLCSGQSNMAFSLSSMKNAVEEIAAADLPELRLFTVRGKSALAPVADTPGGAWKASTPETAREFSAVAFLFGRELHKALGVPVGLIHSSWSGTTAERWTDAASLAGEPAFARILQRWEHASPEAKALAAGPREFELEYRDFELVAADGSRKPIDGIRTYSWQAAPNTVIERVGSVSRVSGRLEAGDSSILEMSFRRDRLPEHLSAYTGIRFECRGKGAFKPDILEPAISDWDNYAAPSVNASPDWTPVTVWFKDLKQAGWGRKLPFTPESLSAIRFESRRALEDPEPPPSSLYNGMIAPLAPFAMRGAIWYQGEGNAGRAWQYRKLLPAMLQGWRKAWGEGDFPFLVVQLPNFGPRRAEPTESAWAELREAQLLTLRIPGTGLAVTIDSGEAGDVHPKDKAPVGRRLALWALGAVYEQPVEYSGPLFDSMTVEGEAVRVHFRHVGKGLEGRGGVLRGFAIAAKGGEFHWADARIDGDAVVVSSPAVRAPEAVRYAWADNPECNLYNRDGLPASPFRTDQRPGVTAHQR
jgi:sialate O-acetylesterase